MKKKISAAITVALLFTANVSNSLAAQTSKPSAFETKESPPPICDEVPEPVVELRLGSVYKDTAGSVIDKESWANNEQMLKPISDWNNMLDNSTYNFLHYKDRRGATCALAYLDYWAQNDAFLWDINNNTSDAITNQQRWELAQAAASYFKVKALARPEQDIRITWWLNQLAISAKAFWDNHPNYHHNNMLSYTAVGIMQVGILTNDAKNIEWARRAFNDQMDRVSANGSMPLEMERGAMARHYHNWNVGPLLYMAQLSKMIGEDWTTNAKLQRLIDFTNDANIDPSVIEKLSGAKQAGWAIQWGWIGNFQPDDPRRVKLLAAVEVPKDFRFGIPYLGNQEVFRDFIEKNRK